VRSRAVERSMCGDVVLDRRDVAAVVGARYPRAPSVASSGSSASRCICASESSGCISVLEEQAVDLVLHVLGHAADVRRDDRERGPAAPRGSRAASSRPRPRARRSRRRGRTRRGRSPGSVLRQPLDPRRPRRRGAGWRARAAPRCPARWGGPRCAAARRRSRDRTPRAGGGCPSPGCACRCSRT
jgi:hypothetical protein